MRPVLAAVLLLGLLSSRASAEPTPAAPFDRLKQLAGDWEARTAKGATIRVSYRLVAADSVLVQTFTTGSGKETLTVFHPDGARVIATHYCAQGNQPRLALQPPSTPDRFTFTFLDATNLPAPAAAHLACLEISLEGPRAYTEIETYEQDGKPDATTLRFTRIR